MDIEHRNTSLADLRALVDRAPAPVMTGGSRLTTVEIEPGCYLLARDMTLGAPFVFESESFPTATLSVVLDGASTSATRGIDSGFQANEVWLASDNDRRPCRTIVHADRPVRTVELVMTPEWFAAPSGTRDDPAFEPLRLAMERPLAIRRQPLTADLQRIAWSALRPPEPAALAALHYESRALDLLVALTTALQGEEMPTPGQSLRARDRDRMMAVRERIDADPAGVAALATLAAEFGVSPSKLKRDFFCAFGTCVGGYVSERRLQLGRTLIEAEGLSIAEAAFRAGYGHPSNFATAFRRRFGVPPSVLRR